MAFCHKYRLLVKKKEKKLQYAKSLQGVNKDKVCSSCETMETVRQVGMLALSCLGLYFVQKELNEDLMGFKTRKEELATTQKDLIMLRDQMVALEEFCAVVSSTRKKIE